MVAHRSTDARGCKRLEEQIKRTRKTIPDKHLQVLYARRHRRSWRIREELSAILPPTRDSNDVDWFCGQGSASCGCLQSFDRDFRNAGLNIRRVPAVQGDERQARLFLVSCGPGRDDNSTTDCSILCLHGRDATFLELHYATELPSSRQDEGDGSDHHVVNC